MKTFKIYIIILLIVAGISAQDEPKIQKVSPTYFGFTGTSFLPTSETLDKGDWAISYRSKPSSSRSFTMMPYSISIVLAPFTDGLELAFCNTYIFASHKEFGGVPIGEEMDTTNTFIPIIPSLKYRFMNIEDSDLKVGMAFGVASPYGAYYSVDKLFDFGFMDFTVHTGIASKLTTYHAYVGATVAFGNRIQKYQRDFPLKLSFESAWGGSLKQLDKKEEAFVAITMQHNWTSNLLINGYFRIDRQPTVRAGVELNPAPTKRTGFGLSLIF